MAAVVVATQRAKPGEFFAIQQRRRDRNGLGDGRKIKGLNVEYSSSYTHKDVYRCAQVPVHAVTPKTCTSSTVNKVMGRCVFRRAFARELQEEIHYTNQKVAGRADLRMHSRMVSKSRKACKPRGLQCHSKQSGCYKKHNWH